MEINKILESAVVLLEEPLKECKPADIKSILTQDHSDKTLAACFASVHNQTGWLAHNIDDEENDEETNNRITKCICVTISDIRRGSHIAISELLNLLHRQLS